MAGEEEEGRIDGRVSHVEDEEGYMGYVRQKFR